MRTTRIRTTRRVTDVVGDISLVGWVVVWLVLASSLRDTLDSLSQPLERLGTTTGNVADRLEEAGAAMKKIAIVGDRLAGPFPEMASAMRQLSTQLTSQVESLGTASTWLVPLVFLLPTVIGAGWYIPWRIRRAQETAAARAILGQSPSLELFALRGIATTPLRQVAGISANPVPAWRAGDPATVNALAELELARLGIELDGGTQSR